MSSATRWGEPRAAWGALVAVVVCIVLAAGTRASLGVFVQPIEADLGVDRLTLSTAGALTQLCYGIALPTVGWLVVRYGARPVMMFCVALMAIGGLGLARASTPGHLYLFAGVIPGLGFGGAGNVPAGALLARWFGRHLGMATGIMNAAIPLGQGLIVPIAAAIIPVLGWRQTYVLLGILLAVIALPVLGVLAREPNRPRRTRAELRASRPRAGPDIWLLGAGFFGCGFTDQFVVLHLVPLAAGSGVETLVGASFLSLLLAFGVVGSVVAGRMADTWRPYVLLSGCYLTRALTLPSLLLVAPGAGIVSLGVFASTFGLTYIANQSAGARLVRDRYGIEAVGPLMGSVGLAHQIGGAAGVALGGASVSLTGGYGLSIIVASAVALTGGLLQLALRPSGAGTTSARS